MKKSTKRETVTVNHEHDITKTQYSKKKTPCFNFFSSDFLVETYMMNYEEKGRYIQLLCILHTQGHLPWRETAEIIGAEGRIWSLLERDEQGFYFSERLQYEIDKREAYRKSRQENGIKRYEKKEEGLKQIEEAKEINNTSLLTENGESNDEPKCNAVHKLIDPFEKNSGVKNDAYAMHMGNGNGNGKRNVNVIEKENGNIDNIDPRKIEEEMVEYYNNKTGRYCVAGTNLAHVFYETYIRGFGIEEMKLIIDYCCATSKTGLDLSPYDILAQDTRAKMKLAIAWFEGGKKQSNKKI